MSATIVPFLKDQSFEPELIRAMDEAYDCVRKMLHDKGQPALVQEIIARRVIEVARTGERDPAQIGRRVLETFGLAEP
jgi:hypothetical protein